MAKLEIPLNMNPSLTAALEKVSAYAGRLETERDALVAKLSMVIAAWNGCDYDTINAEINKTPQQHLAEIKADAIESVITEELYKRLKPLCGKNGVSEVEDYLTEQAAKVRGGAV